jgi:hypothetical protein
MVAVVLCGFAFGQVLMVDSILDPGTWVDPENVFSSDDAYGSPGGNNDELYLQVADPTDTSYTIDSVIVFVEQYVSDETKAAWYIRPYFLGVPGTTTPDVMGTETESVITFNITADITGWADIYDLEIGVRNAKVGGGANPEWYCDYVYIGVWPGMGIEEYGGNDRSLEMLMPTIVRSKLCFTVSQLTSTDLSTDIYDVSGKKVYSDILDGQAGTYTYSINDLDFLARGVYYLVVQDLQDNHVRTGKFIVME